ncbi:MAG: GH25 family lysozyme [Deltaproteobacteria bacterium]
MRKQTVALLVAFGAVACGPENPEHPGIVSTGSDEQALTVCAAGATLQGIDVSTYQGAVNWASVASSGRKFGYAKATQGNYYRDSTFPGNWAGMKAAGLVRGAYHWLDGSINGTVQADYYLSYVGAFGPGDLPMVDWECNDTTCGNAGNASVAQDVQAGLDFVNEVKAKTGLMTVIYTGYYFFGSLGNPSQFAPYPLFVADYTSGCTLVPSPWSTWTFWQYSSTGSVPGVSGNCDVDEFNGTLSQLNQLANGGAAACTYPLGHPLGSGGLTGATCGAGSPPGLPATPPACGALPVGDGLGPTDQVASCDGRFILVMQKDGNVVLYEHGTALWSTGTASKGGYLFVMQGDGNLVLYSSTGCPLWASNTAGNAGASLAVQDDGNLVIYSNAGKALWSSGTGPIPGPPAGCGKLNPGDGLGPGDQVVSCQACFNLVMQGDGNLVLYQQGKGALWSTKTNGQNGEAAVMQTDGNFVLYSSGGCPLWNSGTGGKSGASLAVQDDGNLVVYSPTGQPLWSSGTVACAGGCSCLPPPPPPPPPDAGPPPFDAGPPPPTDAGSPPAPDAGPADAGAPSEDAGPGEDAGSPRLDGGAKDAGAADGGSGATAIRSVGGCGCGSAGAGVDGAALLLLGLALARRRKARA